MVKKRKHIQFIQHVSFETPASILDWVNQRKFSYSVCEIFNNNNLPIIGEFDALIVLGGPMSVNDSDDWINNELNFIKQCIQKQIPVLGICLGAQFLAKALGAKVVKNTQKEIGWFPVQSHMNRVESDYFKSFPLEFTPFHWHGEVFELPENAKAIHRTAVTPYQSFVYNNCIALQFHLEMNIMQLTSLIENCKNELIEAPTIMNENQMLSEEYIKQSNVLLTKLLNCFIP